MHHEFNAASQHVIFSDEGVSVGKKSYPLGDIGNLSITFNATFATRGVVSMVANGKTINFPFTKKETDEMHTAIAELQQLLRPARAEKAASMRTADEMYRYCTENGFGQGLTKDWSRKHFAVIAHALLPDETVRMAFIGLHNFVSMTETDGNYAYAVTDRRIICAQQKVVGEILVSIEWKNINDITMETHTLMGTLLIDTYKETFGVGLDRGSIKTIYEELRLVFDELKSTPAAVPAAASAPAPSEDPYEAIKKLKELLDIGALTQDEFDQKKKALLGL